MCLWKVAICAIIFILQIEALLFCPQTAVCQGEGILFLCVLYTMSDLQQDKIVCAYLLVASDTSTIRLLSIS